jgi:hypothetical protein
MALIGRTRSATVRGHDDLRSSNIAIVCATGIMWSPFGGAKTPDRSTIHYVGQVVHGQLGI